MPDFSKFKVMWREFPKDGTDKLHFFTYSKVDKILGEFIFKMFSYCAGGI